MLRSGVSRGHRGAVHGTDVAVLKILVGGRVEHVVGDVVRVRPHSELRIVGEIIERERVAVVCAGRVGGRGIGVPSDTAVFFASSDGMAL